MSKTARDLYRKAYQSVRITEKTGYAGTYWQTTGIDQWDTYQECANVSYYESLKTVKTLIEDRAAWRKLAKARRYAHPELTLRGIAENRIREYYRLATWIGRVK